MYSWLYLSCNKYEIMKPILIIPVELYPQYKTENYSLVLKIEDINQIQKALDFVKESDICFSIQSVLNDVDVVTLLKMNIQPTVNMYINCSFNGDILSLMKSMEANGENKRSSNLTYLFSSNTPNIITLMKILSSCGYKSGLQLDSKKKINDDDFIELATYSILSPVPHAQIEPFGFIQQEIHDKRRYVDINKFVHISKMGGVYIKSEFPKLQKQICNSIDELSQIKFDDISMEYKKLLFYNHFDAEDRCSKCPNFKICSGIYHEQFDDCQKTMSTIYEMLF